MDDTILIINSNLNEEGEVKIKVEEKDEDAYELVNTTMKGKENINYAIAPGEYKVTFISMNDVSGTITMELEYNK